LSYLQLKTERLTTLVAQETQEQAARELELFRKALHQAGTEARRAIANLQAETPPNQKKRLTEVIAEFEQPGEPTVELMMTDQSALTLPTDDATQVSQIVREALQNARRHAQARHIAICLEQDATHHRIAIRDDGCGFDLETQLANGKGHFGLSIMRARAARLGGALAIQSAPGRGTQVTLSWPVRSE